MAINWRAYVFPPRDHLPADITSIDVLKAVAITLMIIDHVGWLLFPQIEWFRVLGRLCVPLWFFLIGYADTRKVPDRWLIAGIIMLVSSLLVGLPPLPLSVLFTMAIIRLIIDPVWTFMINRPVYFWWILLLLLFVGYVSNLFIEYGTLGLLLAMAGHAVRHRAEVEAKAGAGFSNVFMIVVLSGFALIEALTFGFSLLGFMVLVGGLIAVHFSLQKFTYQVYPGTADKPSSPLVRFMGRYTLEIYVIHLLILKGVFGLKMAATSLIG